MPRVTRAAAHLAVAEVKRRRQTAPHPLCRQRWLIIYNAQVDPRPAATIATHCGVSKAVGPQLISTYPRFGVSAVETVGQGGRYHAYRSVDQERELLAPFFARAETGELATASESKRAFEARVGHEVVECPIYRLLDRVGWRKLMPRPKHPKASPEAQEQFKKNFARPLQAALARRPASDTRPVLLMSQDQAGFGRLSQARRCWARPGMRPHVAAQVVREYSYAYAAVAAQLGLMTALVLPRAKSGRINLFREHVSQPFVDDFIVMQVDQAAWHRSKPLLSPDNICLS